MEEQNDFGKLIHGVGQLSGFAPKTIGGINIPGGPIPGLVTSTGLGALSGYAVSKLINMFKDDEDEENDRRTKNWTMTGGLAAGLPALAYAGVVGHEGLKEKGLPGLISYPDDVETKSASFGGLIKMAWGNDEMSSTGAFSPLVPVPETIGMLLHDPLLNAKQKANAVEIMMNAADNEPKGFVTFGQLVKGAIGAGLGAWAGTRVASVLDGLFGLAQPVQKALSISGGIGGALMGAGLTR